MSAPGRLSEWKSLLDDSSAHLVLRASEVVASGDDQSPKAITSLRKLGSQELVRAAIELARGREKLRAKVGDAKPRRGADWITDVDGAEQATRLVVARHKARRFSEAGISRVTDIACGIGVDAFALAEAELEVHGVDRDPVRAWFCSENAGIETLARAAINLEIPPASVAMHIDPARRAGGERKHGWDSLDPPPAVIESFLTDDRPAAVKLGPGIDPSDLPPREGELEFIEHDGDLVEATWWLGSLRSTERRATDLTTGRSWTGSAATGIAPDSGGEVVGSRLLVPRPCVERSGLLPQILAEHDVPELWSGLGLASADESPDADAFTAFEILAVLPWREKKIKEWLRAHDGGPVEVRTRGAAVDGPASVRTLTGKGATRHVIFGLRLGEKRIAIISR